MPDFRSGGRLTTAAVLRHPPGDGRVEAPEHLNVFDAVADEPHTAVGLVTGRGHGADRLGSCGDGDLNTATIEDGLPEQDFSVLIDLTPVDIDFTPSGGHHEIQHFDIHFSSPLREYIRQPRRMQS
jgi:hypothetical protein